MLESTIRARVLRMFSVLRLVAVATSRLAPLGMRPIQVGLARVLGWGQALRSHPTAGWRHESRSALGEFKRAPT